MDLVEFEMKARAAFELIEDKARQLGLYVDNAMAVFLPTGQPGLVVNFMIGDVAFRPRVQEPDKAGTDSMVMTLEKSMQSNDFLDQRERMKEALAQGLDPLSALDASEPEDLGN